MASSSSSTSAPANAPSDASVSAPVRVEIRPEGDELLPDGYPFESLDEQQIDMLFMQPSISFPDATVRIHTSSAAFALKYPAVAVSPVGFLAVFMTEYNFLVLMEQFWMDAYAIFLFVSAQVMRALAGHQPPAFHIHIKSIFFACRKQFICTANALQAYNDHLRDDEDSKDAGIDLVLQLNRLAEALQYLSAQLKKQPADWVTALCASAQTRIEGSDTKVTALLEWPVILSIWANRRKDELSRLTVLGDHTGGAWGLKEWEQLIGSPITFDDMTGHERRAVLQDLMERDEVVVGLVDRGN